MKTLDSIISAAAASIGLLTSTAYATEDSAAVCSEVAARHKLALSREMDVHLEMVRHVADGLRVTKITVDELRIDVPEVLPPACKPALKVLEFDLGLGAGVVVLAPAGAHGRAEHRWTVRYAITLQPPISRSIQ